MGVYNPQMKMPLGCHRCEYYDVCKISNKSIGRYNAERSPDCPLVEIEIPHGRLIDAKKFHRRLQKQAMKLYGKDNKTYQLVMDIMDAIHAESTVIEAEVE